jgi:hypothetical protein
MRAAWRDYIRRDIGPVFENPHFLPRHAHSDQQEMRRESIDVV